MKNKASPIFKFNLENYTHDCGSRKDFSKYKTPTKQHGKGKQIHKKIQICNSKRKKMSNVSIHYRKKWNEILTVPHHKAKTKSSDTMELDIGVKRFFPY